VDTFLSESKKTAIMKEALLCGPYRRYVMRGSNSVVGTLKYRPTLSSEKAPHVTETQMS
jgi:hypothetical protein